jgi:hypothetical protein
MRAVAECFDRIQRVASSRGAFLLPSLITVYASKPQSAGQPVRKYTLTTIAGGSLI